MHTYAPDGVAADEKTPIVLRALLEGDYPNRRLAGFRVVSCPAYVYRHIFDCEEIQTSAALVELARLNHGFEVQANDDCSAGLAAELVERTLQHTTQLANAQRLLSQCEGQEQEIKRLYDLRKQCAINHTEAQ